MYIQSYNAILMSRHSGAEIKSRGPGSDITGICQKDVRWMQATKW